MDKKANKDKMQMKDQEIFFALIRAAIWDGSQKCGDSLATEMNLEILEKMVPAGYDWGPMIEAFRQHALLGVVANA